MTLNEQQIEELFRFCKKKFVHFYDLQVELVDHLAERIEEEMTANERLSFEEALKMVYAGFGLFGFAHIVQDKTNALQKQHNRAWRRTIRQFFTLPKLLFTAALFMALFTLGKFIVPDMRMLTVVLFWSAGYVYQIIRFRLVQRAVVRKLLFTQYAPCTFFVMPFIFMNFALSKNDAAPGILVFTLLCSAAVIVSSASVEVTSKIYREAKRLYRKAFATA